MTSNLKRTPLYEAHRALGGRIVPFAGYELPVFYTSILEEHRHCRTQTGLFDVSHMGEIWVSGKDALAFLDFALTNSLDRIPDGMSQYSLLCNDQGGIEDDLIVYRFSRDRFLLVVNASNIEKDESLLRDALGRFRSGGAHVEIHNTSESTAQLALQGPESESVLRRLLPELNLSTLKKMAFVDAPLRRFDASSVLIARTGYTGEDGFELYLDAKYAVALWNDLLGDRRVKACGLGARDTLRLEMKYPLYGQDLMPTRSPLEAQLAWAVRLEKDLFVGREALKTQKDTNTFDRWVGVRLNERGVMRAGYSVYETQDSSSPLSTLTSGAFAPSLDASIGALYLPRSFSTPGQRLWVEVRNQRLEIEVVQTPFWKKNQLHHPQGV